MKILVPGGCGYIGSALIPYLLAGGHKVRVLDPQWFGDGYLPDNENLEMHKEYYEGILTGVNAIIYLAGLTNDDECRRLPKLAQDSNLGGLSLILQRCLQSKVKRFIFLSSVTVYGNTEYAVTEAAPLDPTTPYGESKKTAEEFIRLVLPESITAFILRPAGVCGYAPRMRFDLTVNRMIRDAIEKREIEVHGGEQYRPHVHIRNLIEIIFKLLTANIPGETFNVVAYNETIMKTAKMIAGHTGAKIIEKPRRDDRSYSVDGWKLRKTLSMSFFSGAEKALSEIAVRLKDNHWPDRNDARYMNVVPF